MSGQRILKNVSRGTFYLATEQFSSLLSGVLYSFIVLRWLGPEGYGLLTLSLGIVGLASIATGNFEVFLERYSAEYAARGLLARLRRAQWIALGLKTGLGVATGAVLVGLSTWLGVEYDEPRLVPLIVILAGQIVFEGTFVTGRAVLYGLQRFGWIAMGAVVFNILKIAMVAAFWYSGLGIRELAGGLVTLVALHGVFLTAIAALATRNLVNGARNRLEESVPPTDPAASAALHPERDEGSILRSIFRYCLPLLGARAAYLTGSNLSKVVLGKFLDLVPLGYFGFASTVVERFVGFAYALPSALLPSMTELLAKRDRLRFTRLLDKSFRLIATAAATLSFGLFVYAEEITLMLGGEQYLAAVPVLQVMAIVPWVRTAHQPLTMAFYALKHTSLVLLLAVIKLSIEIGAYFLLIPTFGVIGAAGAHLLGAVVAFLGALTWIGLNFKPSRHRWIVMGKTTALFFLTTLATLALESSQTGWMAALAVKLFLFTPVFFLAVFLCDLVTEDDLQRAGSVDIGHRWGRRVRDAAVHFGLRISRAVDSWRPASFRTAGGN